MVMSPPTNNTDGVATGGANGPVCDYAVPASLGPSSTDETQYRITSNGSGSGSQSWIYTTSNPPNEIYQEDWRSPFRMATNTRTQGSGTHRYLWTSRDTIARWQDGTSNQIILGEKHVPVSRIGQCGAQQYKAGLAQGPTGPFDCSCLAPIGTGNPGSHTFARLAGTTINAGNIAYSVYAEDMEGVTANTALSNRFSFGSSHPGGCNFLIGDGSVRFIPATVPDLLTARLVDVSDGYVVSLP